MRTILNSGIVCRISSCFKFYRLIWNCDRVLGFCHTVEIGIARDYYSILGIIWGSAAVLTVIAELR
jgi:hypothetical protein